MKMKMWIGNLDGSRAGLVIAPSKERACKIVGAGRTDFDSYWKLHPVDTSLEAETLYTRPIGPDPNGPAAWQQGRCPLAPRGS